MLKSVTGTPTEMLIKTAGNYGIAVTHLKVAHVGLYESTLRDIVIGDGEEAQRIETITVRYSPSSLLYLRVKNITIKEPRFMLAVTKEGLHASGLHRFLHDSEEAVTARHCCVTYAVIHSARSRKRKFPSCLSIVR